MNDYVGQVYDFIEFKDEYIELSYKFQVNYFYKFFISI